MFTQKEAADAKKQERNFIERCEAYRVLLTEQELPLTLDLERLKTELRNQLFAKLLTVDAGLAMRWEMLRSEEAQRKLVLDTVDLTGYEIVPELSKHIQSITAYYSRICFWAESGYHDVARVLTLDRLVSGYDLDLAKWIDEQVFSWKEEEIALLDFFRHELAPQLEKARRIIRASKSSGATLRETLNYMSGFFTDSSQSGEIAPKEYTLYSYVLPDVQRSGLMPLFKTKQ